VLRTALASKVPIKLGNAILVPYFRNPVDVGFIAGPPNECVESLEELCGHTQQHGFDQICCPSIATIPKLGSVENMFTIPPQ
jgi:hypothetical protein